MNRSLKVLVLVVAVLASFQALSFGADKVSARIETVTIPTFEISKGSPAPALFTDDQHGAYPMTVLDVSTRSAKPIDKEYKLSVLENDHLRVEVNPAVGGRIWRIIDKKTGRNLLWTNDAVLPILVGRRSGWIASGIEFPFPVGNHGEDTMEPYRTSMRENEDGSATITVSSFDHFYRFRGSYDITLSPNDARMALTVRLYNPTPVRNRYQIWINAAVKTGDDMQFIFPVNWVAGHGFGGIHPWPMWDDGKVDRGYWKNQPDQLGVFGWNADFMGAYFHKDDYGLVRYCPHTLAEGIKLWTWGTDSHWTAEYSLNQGSYNEIQGGRWPTQEMYGWLEPHQMDTWTEYWYPVNGLGGVDQASKDACLGVAVTMKKDAPASADVAVNVLRPVSGKLIVASGEKTLLSQEVNAAAGDVLKETVKLDGLAATDTLTVKLVDAQGFSVISYDKPLTKVSEAQPELPETIELPGTGPQWTDLRAALASEMNDGDLSTARARYEKLVEGYPDFEPAWKSLGILLYKQLDKTGAQNALAKAVDLDPKDVEAAYYLAITKLDLGQPDALDALKAITGDSRFTHLAQFALATNTLKSRDYAGAVKMLKETGNGWSNDCQTWDYLALAARLAGDKATAKEALASALAADPLDPFAAVEKLVAAGGASKESIVAALGADADLYVEVALFYDAVGESATALAVAQAGESLATSGLYYYQLAYFAGHSGSQALAKEYSAKGDASGTDYVFPHRGEDYAALEYAASLGAASGFAKYHEATLLYWLGRSDDALGVWESLLGKYELPGLYRKVADAYTRGKLFKDTDSAIALYRKAVQEDPKDVESYYTLDDFYAQMEGRGPREEMLTKASSLFPEDDQIALRMARMLTQNHRPEDAAKILETHKFKRAHQSRQLNHIGREALETTYNALAANALRRGDKTKALEYLDKASRSRETLRAWFD